MLRLFQFLALAVALLAGHEVAAQPAKPITLAAQLSSDIPQLLLAMDKGLWREQGLDVKWIPTASGREAFEALVGGQADFIIMADLPATIAALRKQSFVILGDVSRYGGQRVIASRKHMKLDSLADLNGIKLGTTLGTSVEYLTSVLLKQGNATAQIVNIAPADTVPALVRGDISASVMFPSLYAQARKLLGPDYMEIIAKGYQSHILLAASPRMLKEHPAEVELFLKAILKGDEMTAKDPSAAKQAIIDASKGVMSREMLDAMWPDYEYRFELKNDLVRIMAEQGTWVAEKGMIKATPGQATRGAMRTFINGDPLGRLAPANVQISASGQ